MEKFQCRKFKDLEGRRTQNQKCSQKQNDNCQVTEKITMNADGGEVEIHPKYNGIKFKYDDVR